VEGEGGILGRFEREGFGRVGKERRNGKRKVEGGRNRERKVPLIFICSVEISWVPLGCQFLYEMVMKTRLYRPG